MSWDLNFAIDSTKKSKLTNVNCLHTVQRLQTNPLPPAKGQLNSE